jgi:preprotein translocase SecE subunit
VHYASVLLLPSVRYTLPLLLLLLVIWLAWRIVNLPTFADFLIATEAEMNKVSWTTRQRLFQDTIVVLVTMVLMAIFLFVVDIAWAKLLSSRPIGVLQMNEGKDKKQAQQERDLKW